jgi:pimeloyl-ACP methyl ester carboxylesterase
METQTLTLKSNLKIHTLIKGEKTNPALVLLHGWPSSSLLWRHLIPELSKHFFVLAPDLPGHGKSDKPEAAIYDLDLFRGFILDFFDAFNLSTAHLCIHDLGGMAGLSFAVRHPERIDKFIVMNTSPYSDWSFALRASIFLLKQKTLTWLFLNRFVFREVLKNGFYNKQLLTPDIVDIFRAPWINSKQDRKAFSRTLTVPPELMVEKKEDLRKINLPTLILWGRKDVFFPFKIARMLHDDIKTSRLVAVDKAGHFLQKEQPEFILREMMGFLTQNEISPK